MDVTQHSRRHDDVAHPLEFGARDGVADRGMVAPHETDVALREEALLEHPGVEVREAADRKVRLAALEIFDERLRTQWHRGEPDRRGRLRERPVEPRDDQQVAEVRGGDLELSRRRRWIETGQPE